MAITGLMEMFDLFLTRSHELALDESSVFSIVQVRFKILLRFVKMFLFLNSKIKNLSGVYQENYLPVKPTFLFTFLTDEETFHGIALSGKPTVGTQRG